jgi:hypothetical protein
MGARAKRRDWTEQERLRWAVSMQIALIRRNVLDASEVCARIAERHSGGTVIAREIRAEAAEAEATWRREHGRPR